MASRLDSDLLFYFSHLFSSISRNILKAWQDPKNLPAMQETWVLSLCWEDPLEKGMATHSSILGLPWWWLVKNPPAMWETWDQSLGWEDPLEKGTATHSNILPWSHTESDTNE